MNNPGLPNALWAKLDGRLWHATDRDGASGIVSVGRIEVAFGNRYTGSFCRCRGCVSLFDFGPTAVAVPGRIGQMMGWFGRQQGTRLAIWLEIDRFKVSANLWDAQTARKEWHEPHDRPYGEFIHGVEACHKGPIPLSGIVGALAIDCNDLQLFKACGVNNEIFQEIADFELGLPPLSPSEDSIAERLRAAIRRRTRNS